MINVPDDPVQPIHFALDELPADRLSEISALVRAQREAEAKVTAAEEALKAAQAALNEIALNQLPAAMAELGFSTLELLDGTKLRIRHEVNPGSLSAMTEPERNAIFAWLRAHDCDSLIKRLVALKFGKGEDKLANEAKALLRKVLPEEIPIEDRADIHFQTLKAFCTERIRREEEAAAEGRSVEEPFPRELFKVFVINRAVLK